MSLTSKLYIDKYTMQGSSQELSPTDAWVQGSQGQHPHAVEDGPTDGVHPNRQLTGWVGAVYFPAMNESRLHEVAVHGPLLKI